MAARTSVLLLILLILTACDSGGGNATRTEDGSPEAGVLARVNGKAITESMLELHMRRRSSGQLDRLSTEDRETLLLELVEMELIAQDAKQQGMNENERIRAQVENIHRAVLAQARIAQLRREPVDEEMLLALYDRLYTEQPRASMDDDPAAEPPAFEDIRENLQAWAVDERIKAYLNKLRGGSDVVLYRHPE